MVEVVAQKVYIREDIADPVWNMQNILQRDNMALSPARSTLQTEFHGADTMYRDPPLVGKRKNMRLKECICPEGALVDGYMYIRGGGEDPVITGVFRGAIIVAGFAYAVCAVAWRHGGNTTGNTEEGIDRWWRKISARVG